MPLIGKILIAVVLVTQSFNIFHQSLSFYYGRNVEDDCVKSDWRVYNQFDTLQDIYECADGKTYIIQ